MADAESFLDKAKAKGKEIVGEVFDNDQMKNEGKGEAAAAEAKGTANDAKDKVEDRREVGLPKPRTTTQGVSKP